MARCIATLGLFGQVVMLRGLSISDAFQIEVSEALSDIRKAANEAHGQPDLLAYRLSGLRYMVGRLHGVVFGFARLLIFRAGTYDDLEVITESAMNEANFLTGD
jgi:hypothetical protein